MTATLTDRYVYAVARSLPEVRRADVERELRATIADDIDARVHHDTPVTTAERSALETLGDPDRLAAGYLDRPLHLIGPRYYLDWVRLLKLLLAVVLPFVLAGSVVAHLIAGTPPAGILGATIGLLITTAVHLAFWSAFVFWLLERTDQQVPAHSWSIDQLPTPPIKGAPPFSEMIVSVAFLALFAVALVGQQFVSGFVDDSGRTIPILEPAVAAWVIPLFLVLTAAEIGFAVWLWRAARWTVAHAIINTILAVASAGLVVILIVGPGLFNPEWFAQFGSADDVEPLFVANIVTVVGAVGISIWDIADGGLKARRAAGKRSR